MKDFLQYLIIGAFILLGLPGLCAQYDPQKTEELKNILYEIHALAQREGLGEIRNLIKEGKADPNTVCVHHHVTALYLAAWVGNESLVDFMLEYGADLKIPDDNGVTPLMVAANYGYSSIVTRLLKCGANINENDGHGHTALWFASYQGHEDLVIKLLRLGAAIDDARSKINRGVPFKRNNDGREEIVRILLEHGARLNNPIIVWSSSSQQIFIKAIHYDDQNLPVHNAARRNGIAELKAVLDQHSTVSIKQEVNKPNADGLTPFDIALITRNEEAIKLLLTNGANPSAGLINGFRLANKIEEWQNPCTSDYRQRSIAQQIHTSPNNPILIEIILCWSEMPLEVILITFDLLNRID